MTSVFELPGGALVNAAESAEAARAAVRALNHLTPHGLDYPGDVYRVLGSLAAMAHMLPQAIDQLQRFLMQELDADRIDAVAGQVHAGEPERAVLTAEMHMADAATAAYAVGRALELAQSACAGLAGATGHAYVRATGRCTCGLLADDCSPLVLDMCDQTLQALKHAPDSAFPINLAAGAGDER